MISLCSFTLFLSLPDGSMEAPVIAMDGKQHEALCDGKNAKGVDHALMGDDLGVIAKTYDFALWLLPRKPEGLPFVSPGQRPGYRVGKTELPRRGEMPRVRARIVIGVAWSCPRGSDCGGPRALDGRRH